MTAYRRNIDERIRILERAAASGDLEAASQLFSARLRTTGLSPSTIELLALFNFPPAIAAYSSLERASKPKLTVSLWGELGDGLFCGNKQGIRWCLVESKFEECQEEAAKRQ